MEFLSNPIYSFFRESPNPEYQYWLDNCTKQDEMPYFNETLNNYQCYPLLTQGPCEPNEWFVLEESQPNKTVCVEKPCISELNSQDLGDSIINLNQSDFNYEDGSTTDTQRFQMTKTRQKLHKKICEIVWVRFMLATF